MGNYLTPVKGYNSDVGLAWLGHSLKRCMTLAFLSYILCQMLEDLAWPILMFPILTRSITNSNSSFAISTERHRCIGLVAIVDPCPGVVAQ